MSWHLKIWPEHIVNNTESLLALHSAHLRVSRSEPNLIVDKADAIECFRKHQSFGYQIFTKSDSNKLNSPVHSPNTNENDSAIRFLTYSHLVPFRINIFDKDYIPFTEGENGYIRIVENYLEIARERTFSFVCVP